MSRTRALTYMLVGVIAMAPLTAWWLVGPQQEDQVKTPIPTDPAPLNALGVAGTVTFMVFVLGVVTLALTDWDLSRRKITVAVPLLIGGLLLGASLRIMTAETAGANIGGALLMFLTPVVLAILAGCAWWLHTHLRRSQ